MNKSNRFGMVYMGSKEQILHLISYIFEREYKKKNFIDMFSGGLSVSSFALQKSPYFVYSNDFNRYVIALQKAIINENPILEEKKFEWVSRELFDDVRDNSSNYPDWYVGYVLNVWSFGINQKNYLYSDDISKYKKALHQAIVFNDYSLLDTEDIFYNFNVPVSIKNVDYKKHHLKRTAFMNKFKIFAKTEEKKYPELKSLMQLQHLTQMEHLLAIKQLIPHKDRLKFHSMDWYDFYNSLSKETLENSFIYCDPPYENTAKYQCGGNFDYEKFWNWFRECPYSVYVSSYKAPKDIEPINFDYKIQLLNNKEVKKKKAVENIYWNGKGTPEPTFYDLLFSEQK